MKKICVALLITTLMIGMIPIAAGIQPPTNKREDPNYDGFFGRTFIRGIIFGWKHSGWFRTDFNAIFCRYTVFHLFRPPESGFFILRHLTFFRKFVGYHGLFLIDGVFRGTPFGF